MISPFREDFIFTKLRENETLAKIFESTVHIEVYYDIEASHVIISRYMHILYISMKIDYVLENSADPDQMPHKRHFLLVFTVCQSTCFGDFFLKGLIRRVTLYQVWWQLNRH